MSNETISAPSAERVESVLKERLRGQVWDLHVLMDENGVVLQGHAESYYAKQMAQHIAMKSLGLSIRENQIQVHSGSAVEEELPFPD
jgi:hypothetical protein